MNNTAVILKTTDGLVFGQTVEVRPGRKYGYYNHLVVYPHGEDDKQYVIEEKYVQMCKDSYDYTKKPATINPNY